MKIRHRVPPNAPATDPVTTDYEAEVAMTVAKAEAAYYKAERRLAKQQRKLDRVRLLPKSRKRDELIEEQEALVELRRMELQKYHRMMVAIPASAQHRGSGAHRHVPSPGIF